MMRQNGLRAASFVAVADVDPRIADQLLDLLAFAHVAAYAEPVPGRTGVYRDHHVPTRPIDRLWVDRAATAAAREVLERSLPHLQAELEAAIAEGTVAHPPSGSGATGPAPGPLPGSPAGTALPGSLQRDAPYPPASAAGPAAGAETAGWPTAATSSSGASGTTDAAGNTGSRARQSLDQAAVDARWRDIVAGWDGPVVDDPGPAHPSRRPRPGQPPLTDRSPVGDSVGDPPPLDSFPADPFPADPFPADPFPARPVERDGFTDTDSRGAGWDGTGRRRTDDADAWPTGPGPAGPRDSGPRRDIHSGGPGDDDHYLPPLPARHPPLATATRLGWAGVIAGPLLLVLVVAAGSVLPRWLPLAAVAMLVGGFLVLVSRLHRSPEDTDDEDDGAVV